jgi:hypothetical protein
MKINAAFIGSWPNVLNVQSCRAHCIIHMKTGGATFTDSEVKQIMKDNADGQEWIEVRDLPNPGWIRADRKVMLTKHPKLNGYSLTTSKWIELQNKKEK